MRAVVIPRFGGPEVLELRERPDPVPGAGEVLVRVRATAVNRADLLQRLGRHPAPPGSPPDIPGLEFAGEVERAGPDAASLEPGRRVMGLLGGGGYAEKVSVPAALCMPLPDGLSWAQAAAVPEGFLTAYDALHVRGRLAPGETLLLPAAGSGVGTAAAQLALAAGASVIGLSRTAEKRARLAALGLHAVLDPGAADLAAAIRRASGGGVDLVCDLVGGSALALHLDALRDGGRLVLVGLLGGTQASVDLGIVLRKRLTLVGTVLRGRPLAEKIELTARFVRDGLPLLAAGEIRPVIDRCFPLAAAAAAHEHVERNASFGKVVLVVDGAA
jgi:putative PIG3 family NAD(P)H quinone oxidoreductase